MLRVAIDGPGGTGKSTIAKAIASKLGLEYVDTGAMYRSLGLKALREGIDPADLPAVEDMLARTVIDFNENHTYLDGEDVSGLIRTNEISMAASNISKLVPVRAKVDEVSKYLAATRNVVMEGRDIGTIVITKAAGVNAGQYDLSGSCSNPNPSYLYNYVNAKFNITSVGKNAEYIGSFFEGDTRDYTKTQYNLLKTKDNTPSWISNASINVQNANQTNAGEYTITVTITLNQTDANNYTDGVTEFVFSDIIGTINKAPLTVRATDKSSGYGYSQETLTYDVTEGTLYDGDTLTVNISAETAITSNTPVGDYPISITATNPNYIITVNGGTYSVVKSNASVSVTANDVYYNRALDLSSSASVGNISLTTVCKFYSDSECTDEIETPVNAGTYYYKATVAGTENYNGASNVDSFVIHPIQLAAPVASYNGATVTLANVTADVDGVALAAGTELVYTINSVAGQSYTATGKTEGFAYTVASSNNYANYLSNGGTTSAVYSVEFAGGSHPLNSDAPANIPASIYVFSGQNATISDTEPTLTGYEFAIWKDGGNAEYDAGATIVAISADKLLTAMWDVATFDVTFKFLSTSSTLDTDMFVVEIPYGSAVTYTLDSIVPVKSSDTQGITYSFAGAWIYDENQYSISVIDTDVFVGNLVVYGDMELVAVFETHYNSFTLTYRYKTEPGYIDYTTADEVVYTYGDTIDYSLSNTFDDVAWFRKDGWYTDAERTIAAPATMPAQDLTVYLGYEFNIGQGDVNASGAVDANDITLYRQWIVGGYVMNIVANGSEWDTVTDNAFDPDAIYFLERVADNNGDDSKDVRDISITRMAVVGGYSWDISVGEAVTGGAIVRNDRVSTYEAFVAALNNSGRVILVGNITSAESDLILTPNKDIVIDLYGKTLTIKSLKINTNYNISISNGTIVTTDGIELHAPQGNVSISAVEAYDADGEISLQAASNSLHFDGAVKFIKGNKESTTPAPVKVEAGTHVVIEAAATIEVEKVVVTENHVASENAAITINNNSIAVAEITVEGVATNEINSVDSLKAAAKNGGEYILTANIVTDHNNAITFIEDAVLDLNGFSISCTDDVALRVSAGATLVINGEGNVTAQEACVMAFYGSEIIINGGTYTSIDNFVVGTNGTNGQGGNTITINGGTFNGGIVSNGYIACGIYTANNDVIVVNDGTFNITNGIGILARSGETIVGENVVFNLYGESTVAGWVGDKKITVPVGYELVLDLASNYPGGQPSLDNDTDYGVCVIVDAVSELNEVKSTASAIALGKNINVASNEGISFFKDMTLYLNGYTITNNYDVAIRVGAGATLVINGEGNVTAQEACVMAFYGSEIIINGGTYTSIDNFVVGTNGTNGQGGNTITINAGTFNGGIQSNGYIACGIYVANNDLVVVKGGTFNITNGIGILARSGYTVVEVGVEFNMYGDNAGAGWVGDKKLSIPSGHELVLDVASNYPGGQPSILNDTDYEVYTFNG